MKTSAKDFGLAVGL